VGGDQLEWKAAEEVNELEAVDVFHERYPRSVMGVGLGLWKLQGALVTVTVNCGYDCKTDVGIQS